ncbi:hypothetical protein C8A00DRAFT_33719 [Chaetomidium leptoderma]|uniref:Uncharacterized protein n=1 Tax=Chaetomidium leptoderma TaxID=669021 RepID=A0AAN6VL42_9PEZI|nr:hypothetical protein C8A00DRAFT_33719 [Chaetomidium leptoderma]
MPGEGSFPMIPQTIDFVVAPGTNASVPWIAECCAPNAVSITNRCYVWCQIPDSRLHRDESSGKWSSDIGNCLVERGRPLNESNILWTHVIKAGSGAAGRQGGMPMGVMAWGVVGLALAAALGL